MGNREDLFRWRIRYFCGDISLVFHVGNGIELFIKFGINLEGNIVGEIL